MAENKTNIEVNDNKAVTAQEKNITDTVLNRVKEMEKSGDIQFPENYSYSNALKSAWLQLEEIKDKNEKPVLTSCNKSSIMNCLLDMVIQGLSPAKKQCYFVPFGGKLTLMRSYMGTVAVTKRLKGVSDVKAYVIYDGDEFEQTYNLDTATMSITKFNPKFENIDLAKIKGAFAVVIGEKGILHTEVMNINQIKKAWLQGAAKGSSPAHNNFADQMALKSVINRACKMYINTSDDSDLLVKAINDSTDKEYDEKDIIEGVKYEVDQEIEQSGNSTEIDIKKDVPEKEVKKEDPIKVDKVDLKANVSSVQVKADRGF